MKSLLTFILCLIFATPALAEDMPKPGIISYWGSDPAAYKRLPKGALALINPGNGILTLTPEGEVLNEHAETFRRIVTDSVKRGVAIQGYVPTGYFNHGCNTHGKCQTWERIELQVQTYFALMPHLSGIFFDETAPSDWNCEAFVAEYAKLRAIVHKYKPGALITFNAGLPTPCSIAATQSGEVLVMFEQDRAKYSTQSAEIRTLTQSAKSRGILTWHLIHTVRTKADMRIVLDEARVHGADFVFATDIGGDWQAGDNTWGKPPLYWADQMKMLTKQ